MIGCSLLKREKIQEKFDFQKISQLFIFGDGALKTKEICIISGNWQTSITKLLT